MFALPAAIADLEPAAVELPRDLAVCALADDVAVEVEARRLRGTLPARPTASIKLAAKAFRLFLTLHQRALPIPRAFVLDVLGAALGVDIELRRTKSRMRVASEAGDARREGRPLRWESVQGVRERMAFAYLREPDVAALAEMVETKGSLHGFPSPVADPERLAGQLIAHINARGVVSHDAVQTAWQIMDAVMLSRGHVSELMLVALGMALGVVQPNGEPSPEHLGALIGARTPSRYLKAAKRDRVEKQRTGRWDSSQSSDKSIGRWRYTKPYRRLVN
jgi:hypothetical protein